MSGIEVAGLVLGAFPLIVEGVQAYVRGVGMLRRLARPARMLEDLHRDLGVEMLRFEDNLDQLLEGIVSPEARASLLADKGGAKWKEDWLARTLEQRLRSKWVPYYLSDVSRLREELDVLMRKLELNHLGKVDTSDQKRLKQYAKVVLRACIHGEYNENMRKIRAINSNLRDILTDQGRSDKLQAPAAEKVTSLWKRDQALKLYKELREAFQNTPSCSCATCHTVHLQLEINAHEFHPVQEISNKSIRFSVVVTTTSNLRHVELELKQESSKVEARARTPVSESKPTKRVAFVDPPALLEKATIASPTTANENIRNLDSLCLLPAQPEFPDKTCGNWRMYQVWSPREALFPSPPIGFATLDNLLRYPTKVGGLRKRLILGAKLALNVMELYNTGWMNRSWTKTDILFPQANETVVEKPFICRTFEQQATAPLSNVQKGPSMPTNSHPLDMICNRSLFSLGVVLVELWYGKSLDNLQQEVDFKTGQELADFMTISRLLQQNLADDDGQHEASVPYCNVVECCIKHSFREDKDLEKEGLKKVHELVVEPLLDQLRAFCGKQLFEIFQ